MAIDTSRVTTPAAAIRAQAAARRKRAYAYELGRSDPTGARWQRVEAATLERAADAALNPVNSVPAREPLRVGVGGELVVATPELRAEKPWLVDTVRSSPDMATAGASVQRVDLAAGAEVLEMAVDAAETINAANALEKMLAHQMAALHALAMKNAATAGRFADRAADPHGLTSIQARQIANVEAARSTNAAARASEAYSKALLALERLRNGGKQTVVVQHVAVGDGGQAVIAGAMAVGAAKGGEDTD